MGAVKPMNDSYSILILPKGGTRIQRLFLPRLAIRVLLVAVVIGLGLSGWLLDNYRWQRIQSNHDRNLRFEATYEVKSLRTELHEQREKLTGMQERINNSQMLLSNWKGLREKIQSAMPRARRASFIGSGKEVLQEMETSLTSIRGQLEGLISSIPSQWPTQGWISSGYGRRASPWTGEPEWHTGLDIANHTGTPIYAPGDAVVKYAGYNKANGRSIILTHGQGITTQYGHLSKLLVKRGEQVKKNQQIAKMGSTGSSTNPHLHYEVRINRNSIDPRKFLPKMPPIT